MARSSERSDVFEIFKASPTLFVECPETLVVSYRFCLITSPNEERISSASSLLPLIVPPICACFSKPGTDRNASLGLVPLMSNHVHLVLLPSQPDSLEVLLRRVHGRNAQMVNTRRLRTGHLWQNRYFSCALSENHLRRAVAYVERNSVRAGLVERPEQYPWSSAALHLGLLRDRFSLLDPCLFERWGGPEAWQALLSTPEELAFLRLLRRCTHAGRPFGEDDFVAQLETHFQRRWRRWSFEKVPPSQLTASSHSIF